MTEHRKISSLETRDRVALLRIDSPPVNALSHAVRIAIHDGLCAAIADTTVAAVVLICGGRMFFAGADISEFGRPLHPPLLKDIAAVMEGSAKPIVAAIHGAALGGGFELALACHYRVAVPSAKVGLPEVSLGLMPGAGGTQRLPRLAGVAAALEMMVFGKPLDAEGAKRVRLIDAVVEEDALETGALAFASKLIVRDAPLPRVRDLVADLDVTSVTKTLASFRNNHPRLFRGFKAPENILRAIEAAVALPFDAGMAREAELSRELLASAESAAQRHIFFAERTAAKSAGIAREVARPGDGLIVDRMIARRNEAADDLTRVGVSRPEIVAVLTEFGFPHDAEPEPAFPAAMRAALLDPAPDPGVAQGRFEPEQILARLLYPMINEGAKILEEGVALRASDIDVALVKACGWPVYTGGPMFWADTIGLARIIKRLKHAQARSCERLTLSPLLEHLAAAGKDFGTM